MFFETLPSVCPSDRVSSLRRGLRWGVDSSFKTEAESFQLLAMSRNHTYKSTWQDRALRFDAPLPDLRPRLGEFEIDSINSVEDSKGNNGDRGFLVVTNLRLIWASHKRPRTNLSIGLNSIVKLSIKTANSRLRGSIQALFVMCKYQKSRCTYTIIIIFSIEAMIQMHLNKNQSQLFR